MPDLYHCHSQLWEKIIRIERVSQGTSIIIISTASSKEKPLLPYKIGDQEKKCSLMPMLL